MSLVRYRLVFGLVCVLFFLFDGAGATLGRPQQSGQIGGSAPGLFSANCAVCHGQTGKGAINLPGLPDFTDARFQSARTDDRMIQSITHGRNEMPPFGNTLKQDQIKALVVYVRSFAMQRPKASGPPCNGLLERALSGDAHIYDMTHVLSNNTPTYDGGKDEYRDQKQAEIDKQGYALGIVTVPEHFGTHVDAPAHFIAGLPTIDRLVPSRLIAPAIVIDVRPAVKQNPDYRLSPADVESWVRSNGPIPDGAVVMLLTGWGVRFGDSATYRNADAKGVLHFPGYSAESVKYLVSHSKIVGLGIDTLSIDCGPSKDFEAHKAALAAGLYNIENLANLDKLPARGAVVFVGPLPFAHGSGSPARVLAIAP